MLRAISIALLLATSCASEPDPQTVAACWAINDGALERCADDLPCRHLAYADEIAACFDEADCRALAAWLICAGTMGCTPGPDCLDKCGTKPSQCSRPSSTLDATRDNVPFDALATFGKIHVAARNRRDSGPL